MAKVLDSSALLAVLQHEPGGERVLAQLEDCIISSVNAAEVLRVSMRNGVKPADARRSFLRFQLPVLPFGYDDASVVAEIALVTPHLSFGDCACIALARRESASEVLTADRAWAGSKFGVKIILIR
jgi:PIN domain nuclease of toxin-antitoxin system